MLLVTESEDPDVRELLAKRSSQQAELRSLVTSLQALLLDDDVSKLIECKELLEKVTISKDKEALVMSELRSEALSLCLDNSEIDARDAKIMADVHRVMIDAQDWINETKAARSKSDVRSDEGLGARAALKTPHKTQLYNYEEIAHHQSQELQHQQTVMESLEMKMKEMDSRLRELDLARITIGDLRDSLNKQQEDHDRNSNYYQETIMTLRKTVQEKEDLLAASAEEGKRGTAPKHTSTPQHPSAPQPDHRPRMSSIGGGMYTTGINQEDLLALTTVMQRTSVDMMKDVLDGQLAQQNKFYVNMQTPRVELKQFDGDITKYHAFINRFDDVIGNLEATYSVKLNSLIQACGPTVQRHLQGCDYQPPREGYLIARKLLKDRYGKSHLIVNAWIDKLMSVPKLNKAESLELFVSDLKTCMHTLQSMGCMGELDNTERKKVLVSKLPGYIQNRWQKVVRQASSQDRAASLDDFVKIVTEAAEEQNDPVYGPDSLAKVVNAYEQKPKSVVTQKKKSYSMTCDVDDDVGQSKAQCAAATKSVSSKGSSKEPCACCGQAHFTRLCESFKTVPSEEKLRLAREKHLCELCLSVRHKVDDCFFSWRCQRDNCGEKHNNVFHEALMKERQLRQQMNSFDLQPTSDEAAPELTKKQKKTVVNSVPLKQFGSALHDYSMPVVPVYVLGMHGRFATSVLQDTGGGFTVITKRFMEKVGLIGTKRPQFKMSTMVGEEMLDAVTTVTFPLIGQNMSETHMVFNAVVMDREIIADKYTQYVSEMNKWPHLKALNLPVPDSTQVDILVGQDNAHLFSGKELIEADTLYGPYAARTAIGWTIHGFNIDGSKVSVCPQYNFTPSFECKVEGPGTVTGDLTQVELSQRLNDDRLVAAVDRMSRLDEVPEVKPISAENQKIIDMWNRETRLVDGHVEVPIPFKGGKLNLPDNYSGVLKRHEKLGVRLLKNPELKRMFVDAMKENFKAGYTEDVDLLKPVELGSVWYIPIQPVVSDKKPGRCRIVGDVSFEYMGACLNKAVHQGPNYTASIVDILIKFRRYPYVFVGDVKAMYNQVRVPESQRDCLRILWWDDDDPSRAVTVHRMTTQFFGGSWSPAAAMHAFKWIALRCQDEYLWETIDTILRHFYVDDLLRSILTELLGVAILKEVRALLAKASFHLTKIGSNSMLIMESVPVEDRAKSFEEVNLELDNSVTEQTLGSIWKPGPDVIGFKSADLKVVIYTRRGILSTMASLYDPLGLVSPFILLARILLQDVCKEGYGWDDELPVDLCQRWDVWLDGLTHIKEFMIPRWLGVSDDDECVYQIHTFVDASSLGFGCVSYLLRKGGDGVIESVTLMGAKAKVTPVKVITIPRLELSAATLGVKQDRSLSEFIDIPLEKSVFWSDSTIVLYYINGKAWQYKTFVANRVVYIQEHTDADQWRHVRTHENVADIASRGVLGPELVDSTEWLAGPEFLSDTAEWGRPFSEEIMQASKPDDDQFEMKKVAHMKLYMMHLINVKSEKTCRTFLTCFSRWNRLLRAVCVWHRLFRMLKSGAKADVYLRTSDDVLAAEKVVVRLVQQIFITDNQKRSKYFSKLFPFDHEGILRVGGRLEYSTLEFGEKHPPILPVCHVTDMYIHHAHERTGHGGVDRTYHETRRRFWVLGGRPTIKRVLSACVVCKRTRGKFQKQVMAPLPSYRVDQEKVPFERVGVDYFGPFYVKVGRALVKRYACMYTDLVMRATHVEVTPDLTASAFINSLQRFVSRRGRPSLVVSDNGTNFVGANNELKEALKTWNVKNVGSYMADAGIQWKFNTPTASHHGGVWERLIRSFRTIAMVVMKDQMLTDETLHTFTCLIEQIMNSRPLTKMSENPGDPMPITPEHLLNLRAAKGIAGDYTKHDTVVRRWKQVQYLGDRFWRRWVAEYLRTLQKRVKWSTEHDDTKVGDVVLVMHENTPRLKWPLGLVKEVIKGRDGHVRSVRLKTETGIYVRPVTKLINLECSRE